MFGAALGALLPLLPQNQIGVTVECREPFHWGGVAATSSGGTSEVEHEPFCNIGTENVSECNISIHVNSGGIWRLPPGVVGRDYTSETYFSGIGVLGPNVLGKISGRPFVLDGVLLVSNNSSTQHKIIYYANVFPRRLTRVFPLNLDQWTIIWRNAEIDVLHKNVSANGGLSNFASSFRGVEARGDGLSGDIKGGFHSRRCAGGLSNGSIRVSRLANGSALEPSCGSVQAAGLERENSCEKNDQEIRYLELNEFEKPINYRPIVRASWGIFCLVGLWVGMKLRGVDGGLGRHVRIARRLNFIGTVLCGSPLLFLLGWGWT